MLSIFNDTIFDNRTELEKQLDLLVEKQRLKKQLKNLSENNNVFLNFDINKYRKIIIPSVAIILPFTSQIVFGLDLSKIDYIGSTLFGGAMRIFKYTTGIMFVYEMGSAIHSKSDNQKIFKTIMKFVIIIASALSFMGAYALIEATLK